MTKFVSNILSSGEYGKSSDSEGFDSFGFTDKQSYLGFVKAWKAEYAKLTVDQRETKHTVKNMSRAEKTDCGILYNNQCWQRRNAATATATTLLELRHAARRESIKMKRLAETVVDKQVAFA